MRRHDTIKQTDHGIIVVDLRKLRFRDISMTGEWERLVYGSDLLVMLREFTPANLYH
jgi:hypothetical protein